MRKQSKRIKIKVTWDDIAQGKRAHNRACPVALALRNRLPGRHIKVSSVSAHIDGEVWCLSPRLQEFLFNFDNNAAPVRPGVYYLTKFDINSISVPIQSQSS